MSLQTLFSLSGRCTLAVGNGKVPHAIAALNREAGAAVTHAAEPDLSEAGVDVLFADQTAIDILVNGAIRAGPWTLDTLTMAEWGRVLGGFVAGKTAPDAMGDRDPCRPSHHEETARG